MVIFGANPTKLAIVVLPLLILELYLLGLAFAFLLSAINVKFRDIGFIWEVVLQIGFYATPILYPLSLAPHYIQKLLLLNPMAQIIQDARYYLVTQKTIISLDINDRLIFIILPPILVLTLFVIGSVHFRNNSKSFAEEV